MDDDETDVLVDLATQFDEIAEDQGLTIETNVETEEAQA